MYLRCKETSIHQEQFQSIFDSFQAPKLAPVREFMNALINIGKKLPQIPTKEKKSRARERAERQSHSYRRWFSSAQSLINEMKRMNMNLPARVWIPFYQFPHHVVRIAYTESTVLNSRDRVRSSIIRLKSSKKGILVDLGSVHRLH